jgi:hypothetical protein
MFLQAMKSLQRASAVDSTAPKLMLDCLQAPQEPIETVFNAMGRTAQLKVIQHHTLWENTRLGEEFLIRLPR